MKPEYLAEGNQNIVFKYKNKVLRVSKHETDLKLQETFISLLYKLIPIKYIGTYEIIQIDEFTSRSLISQSTRSNSTHHPSEIQQCDFFGVIDRTQLSIEIKPKWGFVNGKTCRTCRNNAFKGIVGFCPIMLFSNNINLVKKSIDIINGDSNHILNDIYARIIIADGILDLLKFHQQRLDNTGIQSVYSLYDNCEIILDWDIFIDNYNKQIKTKHQILLEYIVSMTLKDVSLFITLSKSPESKFCDIKHDEKSSNGVVYLENGDEISYSVRIGDLDYKGAKFEKWIKIEKELDKYEGGDCAIDRLDRY